MTEELFSIYLYFIVEKVIPLVISEYNLSEEEAIQRFYSSELYTFLENYKTRSLAL